MSNLETMPTQNVAEASGGTFLESLRQSLASDEGFISPVKFMSRRTFWIALGGLMAVGSQLGARGVTGVDLESAKTTAHTDVLEFEYVHNIEAGIVTFKQTVKADGVKFNLSHALDAEPSFLFKGRGNAHITLPTEAIVDQTSNEDGSLSVMVDASQIRENVSWDAGKTHLTEVDDREKNFADVLSSGIGILDNPLVHTKGKDTELSDAVDNVRGALEQKGIESFREKCGDKLAEETLNATTIAVKYVAGLRGIDPADVHVSYTGDLSWTADQPEWDGGKFEIGNFPLDSQTCSVEDMKVTGK